MNIEKAIKLAIENVKKEGLTDIFPEPFEVKDLLNNENFISYISENIKNRISSKELDKLKVSPLGHVLYPKKEAYDFRKAALLEPIDTIIYLSLVLQYADIIEKNRIRKQRKIVFSYRFNPKNGYLFDSKYNYTSFEYEVNKQVKNKRTNVLVKCDISTFYDRLNLHRLESTLLSLPNIDKKLINLTNHLLLFWANRDSYSLPVGGNASRILAEAALISIDDYLLSHNVKFCRFVDDYRLFAPTIEIAHEWLTLLVERLYLEGLTINPLKTVIEDVSKVNKTESKNTPPLSKSNLQRSKIIAGYSGIIPTKFRELSDKEIELLKGFSIENALDELNNNQIIKPDEIRKLVKAIVANEEYNKISLFKDIANKFPQFIPFLIDVLIKKSEHITNKEKEVIKKYFSSKLDCYPEYILISIVKLLGSEPYKDISCLMQYLRTLKRNSGIYIGRAVLDALYDNVSRAEAIEIRQYFNRADLWEKRAIIRLVVKALPEDELRPWLKNIKLHLQNDPFAIEIFDQRKKKEQTHRKK